MSLRKTVHSVSETTGSMSITVLRFTSSAPAANWFTCANARRRP